MRRITIGRLSTNDVCINDRSVTREHCILTVHSDGRCELTDCNSTNGTFVNGNRIHGTVPLQPNDYVRVGNQQLPWRNYIYGDGVYGGSGGSHRNGGSSISRGAINTTGGNKNTTGLIWAIVGGLVLVCVLLVLSLTGVFDGEETSHDPMTVEGSNVPGEQNGTTPSNTTTTTYTNGNTTTSVISSPGETMTIVDNKKPFEGEWEFQNECYVFQLNLFQQGDQLYGSYAYVDNRGYMDDEPDNSIRGTLSGNTAAVSFHSAGREGGGKATITLQSDGTLKWRFKEADVDNNYLFDYIVPDLSILKKK